MVNELRSSIEHPGIVIDTLGDMVTVQIEQLSACSQCHAKRACLLSDRSEKIIEIACNQKTFKKGDQVTVILEEHKGVLAVFLGYLLPFSIVFLTLLITLSITKKEVFSGVLALGFLIPYYFIIWLQQNNIKSKFSFRIKL